MSLRLAAGAEQQVISSGGWKLTIGVDLVFEESVGDHLRLPRRKSLSICSRSEMQFVTFVKELIE